MYRLKLFILGISKTFGLKNGVNNFIMQCFEYELHCRALVFLMVRLNVFNPVFIILDGLMALQARLAVR